MKILFVCTGNTCRSQIAEGMCKKLYGDKLEICESAGIFTMGGEPVAQNAVKVCEEAGADIKANMSKPITAFDLNSFDIIAVMTNAHADALITFTPSLEEKIYIPNPNIPDPYGMDVDVYRGCRDKIIKMIDDIMGDRENDN